MSIVIVVVVTAWAIMEIATVVDKRRNPELWGLVTRDKPEEMGVEIRDA